MQEFATLFSTSRYFPTQAGFAEPDNSLTHPNGYYCTRLSHTEWSVVLLGGGDSTGVTGGNFYNNVQIYQP